MITDFDAKNGNFKETFFSYNHLSVIHGPMHFINPNFIYTKQFKKSKLVGCTYKYANGLNCNIGPAFYFTTELSEKDRSVSD
jgi:hypothetical protein